MTMTFHSCSERPKPGDLYCNVGGPLVGSSPSHPRRIPSHNLKHIFISVSNLNHIAQTHFKCHNLSYIASNPSFDRSFCLHDHSSDLALHFLEFPRSSFVKSSSRISSFSNRCDIPELLVVRPSSSQFSDSNLDVQLPMRVIASYAMNYGCPSRPPDEGEMPAGVPFEEVHGRTLVNRIQL